MRDTAAGLLASLILHLGVGLIVLGAMVAGSRNAPLPVIDLTLLPPAREGGSPAELRNRPAARVHGGTALPHSAARTRPSGSHPSASHASALASPVDGSAPSKARRTEAAADHPAAAHPTSAATRASSTVARSPGEPQETARSLPAPAASRSGDAETAAVGRLPGGTSSPSAASGGAPATITGNPGPEQGAGGRPEGAGGHRGPESGGYLRRAYGSIPDTIQRGIAYPPVARRMRWEGKVVVAFVILPDGSVRNVRVLRGSGFAVLDRNAVDAVRRASPYPRPPSEVEIITPVVYRLD